MPSDSSYIRSTVVPVLGVVALGLFGLNFATFVSNWHDAEASSSVALCETVVQPHHLLDARTHVRLHQREWNEARDRIRVHRIEREARLRARALERQARVLEEQAREIQHKARHIEHVAPAPSVTAHR